MSAYALNINQLRTKIASAHNNDEMAEIISQAFEQIKNDQLDVKKEVLREIKLDHLASHKDLQITEAGLKLAISQSQNKLIWAIIGVCGVWVPAIIGIITTLIFKHG